VNNIWGGGKKKKTGWKKAGYIMGRAGGDSGGGHLSFLVELKSYEPGRERRGRD